MAADTFVGRVLEDRYEILERVAAGGMATVYRGRATRLDREVAVKILHGHLAADASFVQRFQTEARSVARLAHPNVVQVFDAGVDGEAIYIAMEFVRGKALREVLSAQGRFTPDAALQMADQILDALHAAHQLGIVHRDIKPENVLVTESGQVKVADFGIARAMTDARVTKTGDVVGTVGYMAPELLLHGQVSPSVDVYATGVVLYELLTGHQPFAGENSMQIALRQTTQDVPRLASVLPGAPIQLDALVATLTARDLRVRYPTAGEALAALRQARQSLAGPAQVPAPGPVTFEAPAENPAAPVRYGQPQRALTEPRPRRSPATIAVAALAALVVLGGGGYFISRAVTAPQAGPSTVVADPPAGDADEPDVVDSGTDAVEPDVDEPIDADTDEPADVADETVVSSNSGDYSWDGTTISVFGALPRLTFTNDTKLPKKVVFDDNAQIATIDFTGYEFDKDTTITFEATHRHTGQPQIYVPCDANVTTDWNIKAMLKFYDGLEGKGGKATYTGTSGHQGKVSVTPDKGGPVLTIKLRDIDSGIVHVGCLAPA
ncbi:MAG: protein kinase [Propionibacteriaceae bacterium]|jgi:serine/threonine protein kinase|nr:protein kinase [Propionibacteriaceae bacterium]